MRNTPKIVVFLFVLSTALGVCSAEQQPEIRLLGQNLSATTDDRAVAIQELEARAAELDAQGGDTIHVLVQLNSTPDGATRTQLEAEGLRLASPLSGSAWIASIPLHQLDAVTNRGDVRLIKTWHGEMKLHPRIKDGSWSGWAIDPESPDRVKVFVQLHEDIDLDLGSQIATEFGADAGPPVVGLNGLSMWISKDQLVPLSEREQVLWIEEAMAPLGAANDGILAETGADQLDLFPYLLDGTGVGLFVYDVGTVLETHETFDAGGGSRVTLIETTPESTGWHATRVAATAAGDGSGSTALGARGVAPSVDIFSAGIVRNGGTILFWDETADIETDYTTARVDHSADLANNALSSNIARNNFNCAVEGDYGLSSALLDGIVRGDNASVGSPVITIWSMGNERTAKCTGLFCFDPAKGRCGAGYATTPPPSCAKNPIHVGGVYSDGSAMTPPSSWGPCDDGRLKPTVVAPACETGRVTGEDYIYNALETGDSDYGDSGCGTSYATATVSGIASLLIEDWRLEGYGGPTDRPLPALVKALMIHTAYDLGQPGPDYIHGYGGVDAVELINALRAGDGTLADPATIPSTINWGTDSVTDSVVDSFTITVPAGTDLLKASLAWDDPAAAAYAGSALINDLDLYLQEPGAGPIHFPFTLAAANPHLDATTGVNTLDNQEQVVVTSPTPGVWTVYVAGTSVPTGPQSYGLAFGHTTFASPCATFESFDWETGAQGWNLTGNAAVEAAPGGGDAIRLGGTINTVDEAVINVTVPAGVDHAEVSYWAYMSTAEGGSLGNGYDTFSFEIRDTLGNPLEVNDRRTDAWRHSQWMQQRNVDLTAYAGSTVRLALRMANSSARPTTFYIDNLDTCGVEFVNAAPVVSITAPGDGSSHDVCDTVNFSATATDDNDGPLSSSLEWTSDIDGLIGTGAGFSTSSLSLGTHTITASVSDSFAYVGSDSISVSITTAAGGGAIAVANPSFEADVLPDFDTAAPQSDSWIVGSFNSWTVTGTGGVFNPGTTLQFPGDVPNGSNIAYSNGGTIRQTIAGATASAGETYTLSVEVGDRADAAFPGYRIELWIGGIQRALDSSSASPIDGTFATASLSYTAVAADDGEAFQIRLVGTAPQATFDDVRLTYGLFGATPNVSISSPANNTSVVAGTSVTFTGAATDAIDGDLSASLSWNSNLQGPLGTGASFSTPYLVIGTHTITASVEDSDCLSGSDKVILVVTPPLITTSFLSTGDEDGWLLSEKAGEGAEGGEFADADDADGLALRAGDSDDLRTYRLLTSFNTSSLPDDATVWAATLRLRRGGVVSAAAYPPFGNLLTDSRNGSFGGDPTLDPTDYEAPASTNNATVLSQPAADGDLAEGNLAEGALSDISLTDRTQFRTRFAVALNSNSADDYVGFYSGENAGNEPELEVSYAINTPPAVNITAPLDGAVVALGSSVSFAGFAFDFEDGWLTSGLAWESDLDGSFGPGGGSFSFSGLTAGTHTITAEVTDSGGLIGSDSITLIVNAPPTLTINSPADASSYAVGDPVPFDGTATDPEDGDISADIDWTSSIDGLFHTGASVNYSTLTAGTHTITASVVDSYGLPASDSITVTIGTNDPPTVTITAPPDGSTYTQCDLITFTGTASDPEDGPLSASIAWSSDIDGSFGVGASVSTSGLSVGAHTITATVTDSGLLVDTDTIGITVNPAAPVSIPVVNHSFEADVLDDFNDPAPVWTTNGSISGWNVSDTGAGAMNPGVPQHFSGPVPDGVNVAWNNDEIISQIIAAETAVAGVTYTLKVDVGDRDDIDPIAGYDIRLFIGGIERAADTSSASPPDGGFAEASLTYVAIADDHGQPIQIQLRTPGTQAVYDNVRLERVGCINNPPTVTITSPPDGTMYPTSTLVTFTGTASDIEDGPLTGDIVWTSSIDGSLGPDGGSVSYVLSDGVHTITAKVTDSGGAMATDSITVVVGLVNIPVVNHSFEADVLPDYNVDPLNSWTVGTISGWAVTGLQAGAFNPGSPIHFVGPVPDGDNTAFSNGETISQVIAAETAIAGNNYTLSVDIGDRDDVDPFVGYEIQLWIGGVMRASDSASALPPDGGFDEATLSYLAIGADDTLPIEIRLLTTGAQANFDNVRLTRIP